MRSFVRVNASGEVSGQAAGSVETPLTWPASAAASHDHVCDSEWRVPSGQLWPSGLSTVIVQRSPASCASPLHPLELVMCATHPPDGGHVELAVQEVWAPGAPLRFNEYIPLKSSAHAGLANPKENPAATTAAVSPRLMVMVSFRAVASYLLRRVGSSQHNDGLAPKWAPAVRVLVARHSHHSANSQNRTGRWRRIGRGCTIQYCAPGVPKRRDRARPIDYRPGELRPTSAPRRRKQLFSTSFTTAQPIFSGHRENS